MSEEPQTPVDNSEQLKRKRERKGVRIVLQVFPLFIGLVGLYLISSWSLELRIDSPGHNSAPYYIGLAFTLFALQMPLILEVNRRKTKRFRFAHVIWGLLSLVTVLTVLAYFLAPQIDYATLEMLEEREWEHHRGDDD